MRSLSANLTSLEDVLSTVKSTPDIIAISETKLKDDNIYNINIPGYIFVNTNSPTSAGGVGIYISQDLEFIRRHDLEIAEGGIESCWIEITRSRQKNVVFGCLNRHPLYDCGKFHNMLQEILENLNKRSKEAFVLSDANIDLLHYNRDSQTTDYLDMLTTRVDTDRYY